jgi:hypothetical protein
MKTKVRNKRGIEKVMSIFWFAVLIIISFGIFVMIYNFYNYPYDIREVEVDLLSNAVLNCLSSSGKLNSYVFEEDFSNNFLERCDLTFEVENEQGWGKNSEYYVEVEISDEKRILLEIEKGNSNLISSCLDESLKIKKDKLAVCLERKFISLNGEEINFIKILSILRKTEKNVR